MFVVFATAVEAVQRLVANAIGELRNLLDLTLFQLQFLGLLTMFVHVDDLESTFP